MFAEIVEQPLAVTLFTDAYVVRGVVTSRHRRLTDILNSAPEAFIVLSDVSMDEWGSTASPVRADYAQVNLASVLFATADDPAEPTPELRMKKIPEQAFISVPPFRVIGTVHLPPEQDMRLALGELVGRFLPVTDATFWSDTVGEAKQTAAMVAVNHARAQILAPHTDVDLWVGLDRSAGRGIGGSRPAGRAGAAPSPDDAPLTNPSTAWPTADAPIGAHPGPAARDPWGSPAVASSAAPIPDPWAMPTPVPIPVATPVPTPVPASPSAPNTPSTATTPSAPTIPSVPSMPSVPPSRTGLLGRVHGTSATIDLPRPVDEPDAWRPDHR